MYWSDMYYSIIYIYIYIYIYTYYIYNIYNIVIQNDEGIVMKDSYGKILTKIVL